MLSEPLEDLFARSQVLILDFKQIPRSAKPEENIQAFFAHCHKRGINPRLPAQRQLFNNRLLARSGMRYLIGRYGEDRGSMLAGTSIAKEGRTIHLGIDIFCQDLEPVFAPYSGKIIRTGVDEALPGYGHYLILQPGNIKNLYVFMGHLSADLPKSGVVRRGHQIARLGDYANNENGGWSRHLHLQLMARLPANDWPPGYCSPGDFPAQSQQFPNPMNYFATGFLNSSAG